MNKEVVAAVLTTNDIKDNEVFEDLLEQVEKPINQVSADGAYDTFECYRQAFEREAEFVWFHLELMQLKIQSLMNAQKLLPAIKLLEKFPILEEKNGSKQMNTTAVLLQKQLCLESKLCLEINLKLAFLNLKLWNVRCS